MSSEVLIFMILLAALLIIYAIITLAVGRFLAFHDILVNKKSNIDAYDLCFDEEVEIVAENGLILRGLFFNGIGNVHGKTLVLLHGWDDTVLDLKGHIDLFRQAGFNIFVYDQRSHGKSGTALVTFGEEEARDLSYVINCLCERKDVNSDLIGAIGFSLGTSAIIINAAEEQNIKFKAIVLEGFFSSSHDVGSKMLVRKFGKSGGAFVAKFIFTIGVYIWSKGLFKHSEPALKISMLKDTPTLFIRGSEDHMVPESSAVRLIDCANEPKKIWVLEKGGHIDALYRFPEEYTNTVLGFLNEHIN